MQAAVIFGTEDSSQTRVHEMQNKFCTKRPSLFGSSIAAVLQHLEHFGLQHRHCQNDMYQIAQGIEL